MFWRLQLSGVVYPSLNWGVKGEQSWFKYQTNLSCQIFIDVLKMFLIYWSALEPFPEALSGCFFIVSPVPLRSSLTEMLSC